MSARDPVRPIAFEDVDDIIGIAAEQQDVERDRLSVEDLESVAVDLAIPERFVRPAIDELRRRRAATLAAAAKKARARKVAVYAAVAVLAVIALIVFVGSASLDGAHRDALRQRAQVVSVLERQDAVMATVAPPAGVQPSEAQLAEITGSENRVRVERARYDALATEYNAAASGLLGGAWRAVRGLPESLPLSNEIGTW